MVPGSTPNQQILEKGSAKTAINIKNTEIVKTISPIIFRVLSVYIALIACEFDSYHLACCGLFDERLRQAVCLKEHGGSGA